MSDNLSFKNIFKRETKLATYIAVSYTHLLGIAAGIGLAVFFAYIRGNGIAKKANKMIEEAKKEAEKQKRDRILELKEEGYKLKQETERELKEKKEELKSTEDLSLIHI